MRNRSVTFHPDPRLPLLSLPLQLPACPPGGFSSLSASEGVTHRRLGESSLPAAAADAHKVHRGCATSFPKLRRGPFSHLRLYAPKRMSFVDVDHRVFPFFFIRASPFLRKDVLIYFQLIQFVRAVNILSGVAFVILFVSSVKKRKYKADLGK